MRGLHVKTVYNNNGFALITALLFTVLSLVITMALLYMVTAGIRTSAALKSYRTTTEAAYGGTDILVKDLITHTFGFHDYSSSTMSFRKYMTDSTTGYMHNLNTVSMADCFRIKLTAPKSKWPAACTADTTLDATKSSDVSFNLNSASGTPFTVYSKIVDTMDRKFSVVELYSSASGPAKRTKTITMAGNSDTSATGLEGASTTEAAAVTVPHYPYMYRIEVQAQRSENANEKAKISVQYAY